MAVFRCKMCGGDLLMTEGSSTCVCEFCGTEQTIPTVKDENLQGLFNRANVLRMKAEFDKAEEIYEKILRADESEAEAYWGLILCKYGIEYVEDPVTFKRIPTCHRTSYEAVIADEDYKNALKYADITQRGIYETEAKTIDDIQKGILAISQKEDPYDVFICYKETDENGKRTQDSVIANDIYYQLTQEGFKVFYAAITLEDKLGSEYEPYIFSALNTAKVMLCLGTKPEYFSAVWVKNEWSRFLKLMKKDRSKLLIPCYRDMDAYELPEEFAHLQAQDMSKIGFINDLIRGIRKVVSREEKGSEIKEAVIEHGSGTNIAPLLKRAFMFLEDGEWERADDFCEQVLNNDPENAQAYVGKLMAQLKVNKQEKLVNCEKPFDDRNSYRKAVRFASPELKEELEGYVESIKIRNETNRLNGIYDQAQRKYDTAETEDQFKEAASVFQSIAEWKDSREKAADALEKAEETRKQFLYDRAVNQANLNRIETYKIAIELMEDIKGWMDADEKISEYKSALQKLIEKDEAERKEAQIAREKRVEQIRQAKEAARKKKRRLEIGIILIALAAAAVFAVMKLVIIPNNQYSEAEKLLSAGDYDGAIDVFTKLGTYKDAADRAYEAEKAKEEEDLAERYQNAKNLLTIGDYDEAIAEFSLLGNYKDAADRVKEAREAKYQFFYNEATTLENAGEYAKAAIVYGKLEDYSTSKEKSAAIWEQISCRDTIMAGYRHMVGLKSDGTVMAVGNNEYGQCNISGWSDVVAISVGDWHTIGLKSDGTVVAVGNNKYGQCNVSDWSDIVAISAGSWHTVGLKSDGTVVAVGNSKTGKCNVSDWSDITAISAGDWHTIGLKSDGTVVAIGDNGLGQCNVSKWSNIAAISAGERHTIGLKSDGTVAAVGNNKYGQCNVSDWANIVTISVGYEHTVGLKSDGTVVAVGDNSAGQCNVSDWSEIVSIFAGANHTVGLKSDGTVVSVGDNDDGECDVSNWSDIKLPN